MTDQMMADPGQPVADSTTDGAEGAMAILDKISSFGRNHMAQAVGILLPAAGLLAFFYSLYLAFDFLTHDWLELRDVIVATLGMVAAVFVFAVLLGVHGFKVFTQARKADAEGTEYRSSTILRALAGAARGYGEAFLVAVVVAIPFFILQAVIAERNAPVPLFGEGFVGILIVPIVYAIMMLLFTYLAAELVETWVGIRENKKA
jgi:hypothetical protein